MLAHISLHLRKLDLQININKLFYIAEFFSWEFKPLMFLYFHSLKLSAPDIQPFIISIF